MGRNSFYILSFGFTFSTLNFKFPSCLSSALYNCKEFSTNQPFLCKTNPILSAVGGLQMNVTSFITRYYENKWQRRVRKNKANSNPISVKAKMNVNLYVTKDYRKKDDFAVRKNKANSNPISEKSKMNVNLYVIEDYENETVFRLEQNKPNQTQSTNPHFYPKNPTSPQKISRKILFPAKSR